MSLSQTHDASSEHRDPVRCKECGGSCCRLYSERMHGGNFIMKVRSFVATHAKGKFMTFQGWEEPKSAISLFDPVRAWGKDDHIYRQNLAENGVDPTFCQYHSDTGCLLAWEDYPPVCKEYRCMRWKADELTR